MQKFKKVLLSLVIAVIALAAFRQYRSVQQAKQAQVLADEKHRLQLLADAAKAAQDAKRAAEVAQRAHIKVMVMPYENGAAARSLAAMSLGIPAHIAERLETDPNVEPLNGPLVLTEEQAQLVSPLGKGFDLAKANKLAVSHGASHFLTGRFSGQVWVWTFETDLYAASASGPTLVGKGTATGDLTDLVKTQSGKMVRTNSAVNIFKLLGASVDAAFVAAGDPLAPETQQAVATPPTQDAFAWLKLSRAYVRYFGNVLHDGIDDTAIGLAKVAAIIDPKQAEAQRFFAAQLLENDLPKLARIHYEFAIAARPTDVRSLIQLGKLELDADNPDIAAGYLKRATESRPGDGDTYYWYATALLKLGKSDEAVTALEKARTIQWWNADARKLLANQYADRRLFKQAAAELDVVANRITTGDPDVVYLEAACLRAADDTEAARKVLGTAATRFPNESRMHKFRADLFLHDGQLDQAKNEYRQALQIAPGDSRAKAMLNSSGVSDSQIPLGGDTLITSIKRTDMDAVAIEESRSTYQSALNAAISDLHNNADKACVNGRSSSAALLAEAEGKNHQTIGTRLNVSTRQIGNALRGGEGAALTPAEQKAATDAIADAKKADADAREMRGQFQYVFVPLYKHNKCDTYDGPITASTAADIKKMNQDWVVSLPVIPPKPAAMPFSPVLDVEQGRTIRFLVDNREGISEEVLTVDGKELGSIIPGSQVTFSALFGYHSLCLLPKGSKCGAADTLRAPFLHDGWTIRVRHAK